MALLCLLLTARVLQTMPVLSKNPAALLYRSTDRRTSNFSSLYCSFDFTTFHGHNGYANKLAVFVSSSSVILCVCFYGFLLGMQNISYLMLSFDFVPEFSAKLNGRGAVCMATKRFQVRNRSGIEDRWSTEGP